MPPDFEFHRLGLSLLLGLLVGLQREHKGSAVAGMRTFTLITVLGTVAALVGDRFGGWIVAAGFLGVVIVLAIPQVLRLGDRTADPSTTTGIAAMLMYAVGVLLAIAPTEIGVAVGGGVAILLQFKPELHGFSQRLGDSDLKAIMQFVLITCIILPILPHHLPATLVKVSKVLEVLNPYEIWLFVALIVGINLSGYIAYKFFGGNAGILLGGILGGAISSTATTVSYSRRNGQGAIEARSAATVILIASGVVFFRLLVLVTMIAAENSKFLESAVLPLVGLGILTLLPAVWMWRRVRGEPSDMPEHQNPTEIRTAILFALMYAVVLLGLTAAKTYASQLGDGAMVAVAALSGATDMDAITLSTARMAGADDQLATEGWRLIIVAALANLAFKAGVVAVLGTRRLFGQVLLLFSVPAVGGILLLTWLR